MRNLVTHPSVSEPNGGFTKLTIGFKFKLDSVPTGGEVDGWVYKLRAKESLIKSGSRSGSLLHSFFLIFAIYCTQTIYLNDFKYYQGE